MPPRPRRWTLTKCQGHLELLHPGRGPQKQPVCLGLRQATLDPTWLPSLPLRPFSLKTTARSSQFSLGTQGHSSYLGCNPGSHQKPRFSVSSARQGIETSASTPRAQAGSGLSSTQRRSPGAVTQMGLSRLRAGEKPPERPVKTHRSPTHSLEAFPAAGTEVISSQEAGKIHINTRL